MRPGNWSMEQRGDGALFEITWHAVAARLLLPMGL